MSSAKKNIFQTKEIELQIKLIDKSQKPKVNEVKGNELLVLLGLIELAHKLNSSYSVYSVTPKVISQKCGVKPLEVIKHLQSLHKKKVIFVITNPEEIKNNHNQLSQNQCNKDNRDNQNNQYNKKDTKTLITKLNLNPFKLLGIELNFEVPVLSNKRFQIFNIFNNQSKRSKHEYIQ